MKQLYLLLFISHILYSCDSVKTFDPPRKFLNIEEELRSSFSRVENNSIIELEEGNFIFSESLILEGKDNVTIRGKGILKTVLSFKDNTENDQGIRIFNCSNITLEEFTVEDANGYNIIVTYTNGLTIQKVKSAWTGIVNEKNGAYGIYSVLCENVLIEECEVLGGRDAGIFIGQSQEVTILKNTCFWNVAGIITENSVNVNIYSNNVHENTGGILVFDIPGLTKTGENIEVHSNEVFKNNSRNFAYKRNIAGIVPPGTGILILAARRVNVHNNLIKDNRTIGVGIISYEFIDLFSEDPEVAAENRGSGQRINRQYKQDLEYDPYPGDILIHDNHYSNRYIVPDLRSRFGKIFLWKFGLKPPYIAWDGIKPEGYILSDGRQNPAYRICVDETSDVERVILDVANEFKNLTTDPDAFLCD